MGIESFVRLKSVMIALKGRSGNLGRAKPVSFREVNKHIIAIFTFQGSFEPLNEMSKFMSFPLLLLQEAQVAPFIFLV